MASEAFSREFDACRKLNHPCIVPTYGFSAVTKEREATLIMKYMENRSLADGLTLVKAGTPPSFWTDTGIGIIVAGIVCGPEFIHLKGFVHRDLKPCNFLIDKDGRCYSGDLGSSRLLEGATYLSSDKNTIGYTAPELYDQKYNWKIDIFSFAMVLYEILVGHAVYEGHAVERTMYMTMAGTQTELPPKMLEEVKSLITRCWSGDPNLRPSFNDILQDLEQIDFNILPGVDSLAVKRFAEEVHGERKTC
jgi:serine/threonine-protein kinase TNNI3K